MGKCFRTKPKPPAWAMQQSRGYSNPGHPDQQRSPEYLNPGYRNQLQSPRYPDQQQSRGHPDQPLQSSRHLDPMQHPGPHEFGNNPNRFPGLKERKEQLPEARSWTQMAIYY